MRIGVDVMGGDHAPGAILEGALDVVSELHSDDRLVLFGDASVIEPEVSARFGREPRIEVVPTTQVIGMDESPVDAVRSKKDTSIVVACRHASRKAEHPLDAVISAGSTGANVTAAQMYMRRLPNVHRPGVAVPVPTFSGPVVLIDVGANIEPKPLHLSQYGVMGAVYAKRILGIEDPRVALMNVGGEEAKGTADMKKARDLLRGTPELNFIGFVEGRGVFNGRGGRGGHRRRGRQRHAQAGRGSVGWHLQGPHSRAGGGRSGTGQATSAGRPAHLREVTTTTSSVVRRCSASTACA